MKTNKQLIESVITEITSLLTEGSAQDKFIKNFKAKFDKIKFTKLLKARKSDPEDEDYHDAIKTYLNKFAPDTPNSQGLGTSFCEQWYPGDGVVEGMSQLKEMVTDFLD